jgi:hypothetical protein
MNRFFPFAIAVLTWGLGAQSAFTQQTSTQGVGARMEAAKGASSPFSQGLEARMEAAKAERSYFGDGGYLLAMVGRSGPRYWTLNLLYAVRLPQAPGREPEITWRWVNESWALTLGDRRTEVDSRSCPAMLPLIRELSEMSFPSPGLLGQPSANRGFDLLAVESVWIDNPGSSTMEMRTAYTGPLDAWLTRVGAEVGPCLEAARRAGAE